MAQVFGTLCCFSSNPFLKQLASYVSAATLQLKFPGMKFFLIHFFFLSGFFFTDTDDSQDSRGREATIFYSTLPLTPAHEHSGIYLQLCIWDDYHMFLIATLVFTRLLLDDILPPYGITIWLIDDGKFVYLMIWY